MNTFLLKIITPEGVAFEKQVYRLNAKIDSGHIGIMAKHTPLVANLKIDVLSVVYTDGLKEMFALLGGFLNVTKDGTTIIAEGLEEPKDINLKKVQMSKEQLEKDIKNKHVDATKQAQMEIQLKKHLARIKVARKI